MSKYREFTHLTDSDRNIIEIGICNGSSQTAIARNLGKDKSTIGKEIKLHRILTHKCRLSLECAGYQRCKYGRICTPECPKYVPFKCSRRDRSPGACNGCSKWSSCHFNKYTYSAKQAHAAYRSSLVDSRQGVNLTSIEAREMANIISPLLKQGLSPFQILKIHPDLGISEKTLYNYIENNVFHELAGITALDLRRQVSRKLPKKKANTYKKRADHKYIQGRTYADYQAFISENRDAFVVQMDTVYNDETNGPFIQTFKFLNSDLLLGFFHVCKTADTMLNGILELEKILGKDIFAKYVNVILTDRGSEFSKADDIEFDQNGRRRTRLYFCDPMQSCQKGSIENNHVKLRYILPKGVDLYKLGLTDQTSLNLVLAHINSAPIEKLNGKSPLEAAMFLYNDLYEKLDAVGIHQIEKDKIILKPYLLK